MTTEEEFLLADKAKVLDILANLPDNDYLGKTSFEARLEQIEEELKNIAV